MSELTVENTGHVVEVPIPTGVHDTLRLDGDRYELAQYHFHAPSEHAINGRLADVEAHLVHHNAQGATAVVGILFRRGPDPNPLLDKSCCRRPQRRVRKSTPVTPARPSCSITSDASR